MPLQDIEAEALQLPLEERGRFARRIAAINVGRTESIPYQQVRAALRALIGAHREW